MSRFFGTPKVQYFDNNGDPLSGGKLYAYEVGTTTLKNTFPTITDSDAGTNANTNPVILDSRGEANVILKGSTKLVLKDSNDNTIWTIDNISETTSLIDENGNLVVDVTATASAVNYILLTNSATGSGPIIGVAGSDTNIDLTFQTKGTGDVSVSGASLKLDDNEGIKDDSGNEILIFQKTASAVNYFDLTNNATGSNPILEVVGDDTNIGFNFQAKGTGTYNFLGSATQAAYLRLYEDTDNGSNYIEIQAPASIASNKTLTIPDASGALGIETTQAAMEAETDESTYVTPDMVKYSPGVAKAWVNFDAGSSPTINASYNITSVAQNSTGNYTVTIATDMSSANYIVLLTPYDTAADMTVCTVNSQAAGTITFQCLVSGVAADADKYNVVVYGDL